MTLENPSNQPTNVAEREIIFSFARRLRGEAYRQALQFLIQRDGTYCKKCGKSNEGQTIDHINPNFSPLHSSNNLQILCFRCNSGKGGIARSPTQTNVRVREREKTEWTHEREYSAEEGEKHEVMRSRWNAFVESLGTGTTNLVKMLVNKAPSVCGDIGSSITYRRYLDEDIAKGLFEEFRDDGRLWVRKL